MNSRSTDIVFLLGAGASVEAGIPASATMIDEIEKLLVEQEKWRPFQHLYNHVKSAIHYAAGVKCLTSIILSGPRQLCWPVEFILNYQ